MVEGINFAKKKRGRPRKNGDKGELIEPSRKSTKTSLGNIGGDMSMSLGGEDSHGGGDFTEHTITINTGEDIIERIMSFKRECSREIIVLSVSGVVANVKIQLLDSNRKVLTFKDAYKIISLSRPMVDTQDGGVRNETGEWRIMIGGADKYVVSGSLVGGLMAASPVRVGIGSFFPLNTRPKELASSSTERVQHPSTRRPSHSENLGFERPYIDLNQPPLDFES